MWCIWTNRYVALRHDALWGDSICNVLTTNNADALRWTWENGNNKKGAIPQSSDQLASWTYRWEQLEVQVEHSDECPSTLGWTGLVYPKTRWRMLKFDFWWCQVFTLGQSPATHVGRSSGGLFVLEHPNAWNVSQPNNPSRRVPERKTGATCPHFGKCLLNPSALKHCPGCRLQKCLRWGVIDIRVFLQLAQSERENRWDLLRSSYYSTQGPDLTNRWT